MSPSTPRDAQAKQTGGLETFVSEGVRAAEHIAVRSTDWTRRTSARWGPRAYTQAEHVASRLVQATRRTHTRMKDAAEERRSRRDARARMAAANVDRTIESFLAEVAASLHGTPAQRDERIRALRSEIQARIMRRCQARSDADAQTIAWEVVAEYGDPATADILAPPTGSSPAAHRSQGTQG